MRGAAASTEWWRRGLTSSGGSALAVALAVEPRTVRQILQELRQRQLMSRGARPPRVGRGGSAECLWRLPEHSVPAPVSAAGVKRRGRSETRKREAHPERMALRRTIPAYRCGDF